MTSFVDVVIQNRIGIITFFNEKSNSLDTHQLALLTDTITTQGNSEDINILLLKSEGTVFCSGASFDELLQVETASQSKQFFLGFQKLIYAIINCPVPIIGLVQGKTIGGGLGIVAACDYVIGTENTQFRLSEINIGIGPFVIEPIITKKIGVSNTANVTYNPNEWFSAEWSMKNGLIHHISTHEELFNSGLKKAIELSKLNKNSLIALKQVFWENKEELNIMMIKRAEISSNLILKEFSKNALLTIKNSWKK